LAEVGEFADVVNLHLTRLLADLTNVREESCDEFLVRIVNPDRLAVATTVVVFCWWSGISPNRPTSGFLPLRPELHRCWTCRDC